MLGGMQLGSVSREFGISVGYGGEEQTSTDDFWVLCAGSPNAVILVEDRGGAVPATAMRCGWEADGTPLYAAVCTVDVSTRFPGKTRPGLGGANYAHAGKEVSSERYHVLTLAHTSVLDEEVGGPSPPQRRFLLSVSELLAWQPKVGVPNASLDMTPSDTLPRPSGGSGPRVLLCHDMKGGCC